MITKQNLLILITATLITLSGCGGGSGDETTIQPLPQPEPEPEQRPYRLFSLSKEIELETTFFELTEEHLYEFTVKDPSRIKIKANIAVRARYHQDGAASINDSFTSPIFTVLDENNKIINTFGGGYDEIKTHNVDIGILQEGTYFIVTSFPLKFPEQEKYLNSISSNGNYKLFLTYYNTLQDIYGTEQIDLLRGDYSDQEIYGYSGNDNIYGEAGNDIIYGNEGNDNIYGDAGNDIIYGNEGDDKIYGGIGADELTGGEGQDIFLYTSPEESTFNLTERDIVRDFSITEDFIDISDLPEYNLNYKYNPSNYFNGSEPDVAGYVTLWFFNGALYGKKGYYEPANPSYDFIIELDGVTSLPVERIIFP